MKNSHLVIDEAEVAALLGVPLAPAGALPRRDIPRVERSRWVHKLVTDRAAPLDIKTLCEIATESPEGPLGAIWGLLLALTLRHADDDTTMAALIAISDFHMPNLLDDLAQRP
jgi:hypothetical protein